MYFAMDKGDVSHLAQELTEQLNTSQMDLNWYALLDSGFDHGRRKVRLTSATWPLYFQHEWGELREVSPLLITLPASDPATLQRLLQHGQGRPMLSFVASLLDAEALRAAWQRCLSMATTDGQSYVLRFADTRITAALPQALSPDSWQRLSAPLEQWLIVDRSGRLQALPVSSLGLDADEADEEEDWELSDKELAALLQAAQADNLADKLHDDFSELLPESGAMLHSWLQRTTALLLEYHIEQAPDQLMLAVAVCCSQGALLDDSRLIQTLANHRKSTSPLEQVLADLFEPEQVTLA